MLARVLPAAFVLASAFLLPTAASAQTAADEEARTHFESGRLYFDRGDYDGSLREFQAAYDLSHRPALLYNIYLSLERLGRVGEAADRLEQFLRDTPDVDATTRDSYESRIVHLRERAAQERPAEPEPAVAPPPEGIGTLGIVGIAGLAAGGASLVVFAITGGMAIGEDATVASRCGELAGRTCSESDVSTLRTLTTTADVTLSIGLVLAAAGATLLAIDLATSDSPSDVAIAPMISPTLAGIQIGGAL